MHAKANYSGTDYNRKIASAAATNANRWSIMISNRCPTTNINGGFNTPRGLLYLPFQGGGPGVSLTLCCFVVYSTRQFVLCLTLCHFVLGFFSPFSIAITSLGEERANLRAFCTFVWFVCLDLSVYSSSWCLGRAAVCECGTPWTFLLPSFGVVWSNSMDRLYHYSLKSLQLLTC